MLKPTEFNKQKPSNIMKKIFYLLMSVLFSCSLLLVTSCGGGDDDEDEVVTFNDVTIKSDETYSITNGKGVTWTSSNDLVAKVDEEGVVTAVCAGTAKLTSTKGSFTVTVKPSYTLYSEPYLKWGASANSVKSAMLQYTPYSETSTFISYANIGVITLVGYTLKDSKLSQVDVAIPTTAVSAEGLVKHLTSRYVYVTSQDNVYGFISPTKDTAVLMSIQTVSKTTIYLIDYVPYTSSTTKALSFPVFSSELFGNDQSTMSTNRELYQELDSLLK